MHKSSIQPQVPAFAFSAVLCLAKTSRKLLGILTEEKSRILLSLFRDEALPIFPGSIQDGHVIFALYQAID